MNLVSILFFILELEVFLNNYKTNMHNQSINNHFFYIVISNYYIYIIQADTTN